MGLWFTVQVLGFRVEGLGLRVASWLLLELLVLLCIDHDSCSSDRGSMLVKPCLQTAKKNHNLCSCVSACLNLNMFLKP